MKSDLIPFAFLFPFHSVFSVIVSLAFTLILTGCPSEQTSAPPSAGEKQSSDNLTLTIVYDNYPGPENLKPDWGFACLIEGLEKTILFDTGGNGPILLENMRQLNLDPQKIDLIVISHVHGDHTNGLESILMLRPQLPVYIPAGFPESFKQKVRSLGSPLFEGENSVRILPAARTTGTLGHSAIVEQGLCIKTADGWVLITGCAHPGVDNLAQKAQNITPEQLYMVLGGFHMASYSDSQVNAVIDKFQSLGITHAAPTHCTGDNARNLFKKRLAEKCTLPHLGYAFSFPK